MTVERIFELIQENGLTAKEFANKVGVSQGNITDWKTGRAKPSVESLQKIAKLTDVRLEWLTGDSEFKTTKDYVDNYMRKQDSIVILKIIEQYAQEFANIEFGPEHINEFIEIIHPPVNQFPSDTAYIDNIDKYLRNFDSIKKNKLIKIIVKILYELTHNENNLNIFHNFMNLINDKYNTANNPQFYMSPIYSSMVAGRPNWEEYIEGRIPIDPVLFDIVDPEEYFFFRVNSENMNNVINNGAYAFIHKQDTVENGEIAVVLVNDNEAILTKYNNQDNLIILEPMSNDNSFQIQIYNRNTPIIILGKYVGKFEMNT